VIKPEDILNGVEVLETKGNLNIALSGIAFDSRQVLEGNLFVAVSGTQVDGHHYIDQAINKGASAIICQEIPKETKPDLLFIKVKNSAIALGQAASNYFENPSSQIKLVGITGTNGKTTTATLLYNLFKALGYKAGLLSTVLNKIGDRSLPATHTTPDALQIHGILRQMVDEGCEFAFMEVSSHAIDQDRVAGIKFTGTVFTNITHDHLDYHKSFKNYLAAKKKLFDGLNNGAFALSNIDDKNGKVVLQNTNANKFTYGLKNMADFKGKVIENHFSGMQLLIDNHEVHTLLTGNFNAYNLLAAYSTAILLKQNQSEVLTAISGISGAEGRFDIIRSENKITAIVDYAHTPDALLNVLESINALRTKNEQLITVVGAGGDRDREKRPKMASIASSLSDLVILTSDNPRSEDPEQIIEEMKKGIEIDKKNKTLAITNRKEAIKTAVTMAKPGDIILVAGKGHEKYQEIKGTKFPFDDKQLLTEFLENV
jgi:UDP-N-acetylmuramoyl-L-alanyl-D-glutamate--2,6-diaminopimelate ligase